MGAGASRRPTKIEGLRSTFSGPVGGGERAGDDRRRGRRAQRAASSSGIRRTSAGRQLRVRRVRRGSAPGRQRRNGHGKSVSARLAPRRRCLQASDLRRISSRGSATSEPVRPAVLRQPVTGLGGEHRGGGDLDRAVDVSARCDHPAGRRPLRTRGPRRSCPRRFAARCSSLRTASSAPCGRRRSIAQEQMVPVAPDAREAAPGAVPGSSSNPFDHAQPLVILSPGDDRGETVRKASSSRPASIS